jgi:hypothetical protein
VKNGVKCFSLNYFRRPQNLHISKGEIKVVLFVFFTYCDIQVSHC